MEGTHLTLDHETPDPLGNWLDDEQMDHGDAAGGIEPWRPRTRADLEWLVGRLVACDEEIARVEAQAALLVSRQQDTKSRILALFGADMEAIAKAELARENEGKKRPRASLDLLTGVCKWNRRGGGLEIVDAQAATDWAVGYCPSAFRVTASATGEEAITLVQLARSVGAEIKPELLKTPISETLGDRKDLPPGIERIPVTECFAVAGARRKGGES